MSARLLLNKLEELNLLDATVIADLRRQLDQASRPIPAETLAKLLVDNGHLTKYQAEKLLAEVTAAREQQREARVESAQAKRAQAEESIKKMAEQEELEQLIGGVVEPPAATPPPRRPAAPPSSTGAKRTATRGPSTEEPSVQSRAGNQRSREKSTIQGSPVRPMTTPRDPWQIAEEPGSPDATSQPGDSANAPTSTSSDWVSETFAESVPPPSPAEQNLDIFDTAGGAGTSTTAAVLLAQKKTRRSPWESPLIVVGGFALIVLTVLSAVMFYSLTRGTAAEYFEAAEKDYRDGAYANAISKFDKFLRYFPNDPNASLARVRRQMAQLRVEAEGARDPDQGLQAAQHVLPQIENEPAFSEARAELATLLPDLARAFADRAKEAKTVDEAKRLLAKVDEAMALVNNPAYLPTTLRKTQANVIERIEETVVRVRRDIERQEELERVLANIDRAVAAGQTREALRMRDTLVAQYPGLARDEQLLQRVKAIAEREREALRSFSHALELVPDVHSGQEPDRVILYGRAGPGLSDRINGQVLAVLVDGTVYGIDARRGDVLWLRYTGADGRYWPIRLTDINETASGDWLLVDAQQWALLRVTADSGQTRWKVRVGEPFHPPVVWRDRILLSTKSGRVFNVSALDGSGDRAVDLKQELPVGPQASDRYAVFFQLGQQDHLYVLSAETMECQTVVYLGHRAEQVAVAPTPAVGILFVALNSGGSFSFVHVWKLDAAGLPIAPAQEPIRLDGHIISPPTVVGRRIYFVTSLGAVTALEINPQDERPVTQELTPLPPIRSEPLITYQLVEGTSLFLADKRLVAFDVQASQAQFVRRWVAFEGHDFVGPLASADQAIVSLRRAPHGVGFRLVALDAASGKETFWQTDVGFPVVGLASTSSNQLLVFASNGTVYRVASDGSEKKGTGRVDLRVADTAFQHVYHLPDGRFLLLSRSGRGLIYNPNLPDDPMQLVQFSLPSAPSDVDPLFLAENVVVPLRSGEIVAWNATGTGKPLLPFQPSLKPGMTVNWLAPVHVSENKAEFIIADDQQRLLRIGVVDSGGRRLASLAQATTPEPLVGRLAVLGDTILGLSARSDSDAVWGFNLATLRAGEPIAVPGRVTWGPIVYGDIALLAVAGAGPDACQLMALDHPLQSRWTAALSEGWPVGATLLNPNELLLATDRGALLRLRVADGTLVASVALSGPAAGSPMVVGTKVWIPATDGGLLHCAIPEPTGSAQ